jgi:hypothetical protein
MELDFSSVWKEGLRRSAVHFPSNLIKQREFTATFTYLVTGGFGGSPTIREHLISYSIALQGDGELGQAIFGLQSFTPDDRFKRSGEFSPDEAEQFIIPLLTMPLSRDNKLVAMILEREYHFDDDPEDLKELGL